MIIIKLAQFSLINNQEVIYDEITEVKKREYYEFFIQGITISLKYDKNNFIFIKKDRDTIFKIKYTIGSEVKSTIFLIEESLEFDIPIEIINYTYNCNEIKLDYSIENNNKHTIIFKLLKQKN